MATRLNFPNSIQSVAWRASYQEGAESFVLPAGKRFGITKRVNGVTPASILARGVNQIRTQYADVNNNVIPYNNTWSTVRVAEASAQISTVTQAFDSSIAAGASQNVDVSSSATTDNILGIGSGLWIMKGGVKIYPQGLSITATIPTNGTVRFTLTNSSGATIDLTASTLNVSLFHTVDQIANNIYDYGTRKGTSVFAELSENGIPSAKIELILKKLYQFFTEREGVTDVNDTNIYGDYFDALNGYSTDVSVRFNSLSNLVDLMSTQAKARGSYTGENSAFRTVGYFTENCSLYRHRFVGGYYDGIRTLADANFIYNTILNIEKAYIAEPNRKVAVFGWGSLEGVENWIEANAHWQNIYLPDAGGELIKLSRGEGSFGLTMAQAYYTITGADTYVMWNDNIIAGTEPMCFNTSYIGGASPNKTQWKPTGGSAVQYDASNPSHPQRICSPGMDSWNENATGAHNGAYAGVWLASHVLDRMTTFVYPTFSYVQGGTTKTGYVDGNVPTNGTLGNASISRFGSANPGQCNIAKSYKTGGLPKPVVRLGQGSGGGFVDVYYPFAGYAETITYNITVAGSTVTINHTGPDLGVYYL